MCISLYMDPYKYVVIISMIRISSSSDTAKLIKKRNVIVSITVEYVSSESMSCLCEKPYATNRALYLMISLFSLRFCTNIHLFPTGFILAGIWTTGQKTSRFINECNSVCIASFHLGQSFLCLHSFVFCGSESSSFCMMSKATWKEKILFTSKLFRSHFSPLCT